MELVNYVVSGIIAYLRADWWILLLGATSAVVLQVYLPVERLKTVISNRLGLSVISSVSLGSLTPLCACGTMGVVLSLFVARLPWAPVMAFLVSSPLIGPADFLFTAGILGYQIALALLFSAVILGIAAGYVTGWLEKSSTFFVDQFRSPSNNCTQCASGRPSVSRGRQVLIGLWQLGVRRILFYFVLAVGVGQLIQYFIPEELIISLFNGHSLFSVPLAASLGLPLYVSGPAILPILRTFSQQGADPGSLLAFIIAGKATGISVIVGMSIFMRKKALLLYVAVIYLGAIIAGYTLQLWHLVI